MNQGNQETPEQKLTRLQLKKLEREAPNAKNEAACLFWALGILFGVPLVGGVLFFLFTKLIGL